MVLFELASNAGKIAAELKGAEQRVFRAARNSLYRQAIEFVGKVQSTRLSGRPGLNAPGGALRSALKAAPATGANLDSLAVRVGWPGKFHWVRVHEDDAKEPIRPKSGKFLAIPFKGTTGATQSRARGSGLRPSDFKKKNTFVGRGAATKPENRILFEKLKGGGVRPLFVLVPQVTIPNRLGYFDLWRKERTKIAKAVQRAMAAAILRPAPGGGS